MKRKKLISIISVVMVMAFCTCLLTGCFEKETTFAFQPATYWHQVFEEADQENGWLTAAFNTLAATTRGTDDSIDIKNNETHEIYLKDNCDGLHTLTLKSSNGNIAASIDVKYTTDWEHYQDITITTTGTKYDLSVAVIPDLFNRDILYPTEYRVVFKSDKKNTLQVSWMRTFQEKEWNTSKGILTWESESNLKSQQYYYITNKITYIPANKIGTIYKKLSTKTFREKLNEIGNPKGHSVGVDSLVETAFESVFGSQDSAEEYVGAVVGDILGWAIGSTIMQAYYSINIKNQLDDLMAQLKEYKDGNYHIAISFGKGNTEITGVSSADYDINIYPIAVKSETKVLVYGEIGHDKGTFAYK